MRDRALQFILWLGDFVEDGTTGKPSVKRYGVALGATVLAGVMFGLGAIIVWSAVHSIGDERVRIVEIASRSLSDVLMWFVIMVTGNYAGGKLIERVVGKKENDESIDKRAQD